MYLRTLGHLLLEGCDFRRVKPLLLTAYLTLEGGKSRRYLAELFWPGARDSMNSLSVALSQLRRGAPGVVDADEERAWSNVRSDVQDLESYFVAGNLEGAVEAYRGPFLNGVDMELGEELEEWLYSNRERVAGVARQALLRMAELRAGKGDFDAAAGLAERAYLLPGAAAVEPEELMRFYSLLAAGRSPVVSELREEADAFDISLTTTAEEARARLRRVLVGRERELERLQALREGEWAWLRGESGMGKTAMLRQLEGTYLPARAGLPYATLEPLLADCLGESEAVMRRHLAAARGTWLVDDWEDADEESRLLLRELRALRPKVRVVLASSKPAAVPVDIEIGLGPLAGDELGAFPEAWEKTGGLPDLVGAYLREEPIDEALERRLLRLGESAREVYLGLALLEEPDAALVRGALGLSGASMGAVMSELLAAGLIEPSMAVRARRAAAAYLESRPALMAQLALRLARQCSGTEAFPLYQKARTLWEPGDEAEVAAAYFAWGEELLRRGFAGRAVEVLQESPRSEPCVLLLARALEQAGRYREALDHLSSLSESPLVSALKSSLYWRLGQPEEARQAAERGLGGDTEARAEALNTLGVLARSSGDHEQASSFARRAAALWKTLGNRIRWVAALNNLGIARTLLGESADTSFAEALEAAGESGSLRAKTLLNVGWTREREGELQRAEESYHQAAELAAAAGVNEVAARAWNNLAVLRHKQDQVNEARECYEVALSLAQAAGEQRILGVIMANLAELTLDLEAWEEALRILEKSGHRDVADAFRSTVVAGHPFFDEVSAPG